MIRKFSRTLWSLGGAFSDFETYFMTLKRGCFKSGSIENCEGGPTFDEARNDYRDAVSPKL